MRFSTLVATAGALAAGVEASNNYLGFNSGATLPDRSAKFQKDFEAEFKTAQNLQSAPGKFNAVRLYTNIQAYSQDDPIQAFDAAVATKTYILLGVWASGVDNIDKELSALNQAITKHGKDLGDLVIGISIGSEDLYRVSATGIKNKSGVGASPDTIVKFINDFKKKFANSPLSKVPVGHVDTWDSWTNSTNKAVLDACDWIGVDEYPYYETGKGNSIKNAGALFDRAYDATVAVANGKPVWVTETGWPATGPDWDEAVCSVDNAQKYWQEVGCRKLFNKTPTFWYNLRDSNPDNKQKFAITKDLSTTPLFDLTCPDHFDTKDSSSSSTGVSKPTKSSGNSSGSPSQTSSDSDSKTGSDSGSPSQTSKDASSKTGSPSAAKTSSKDNAASALQISSAALIAAGILALF